MNEVIFEHGGTIDKFIGDAIMVLLAAHLRTCRQKSRSNARPTAQKPCSEQWRASAECGEQMEQDLQMRIGIHHGSAVVGNFGSSQRSDYTAIGPCVNMAARIESASVPGEVFISEAIPQS